MLFPLHASATSRRLPVLTVGIMLANLVVYWHQEHLRLWEILPFHTQYTTIPAHSHTLSLPVVTSLFTSMFMHADRWHLIGNMWFLWIFGGGVEDKLGRTRFTAFYFLSGIVADLLHIYANPTSTIPTLGASGAIAGVLGAYLCMFPTSSVSVFQLIAPGQRRFDVPAAFFLGFWIVMEVGSAYAGDAGMVAVYAHIGGFIAGAVLALVIGAPRKRSA